MALSDHDGPKTKKANIFVAGWGGRKKEEEAEAEEEEEEEDEDKAKTKKILVAKFPRVAHQLGS